MGPPAMPSLGGRFPITGLGAAAALCGERRAQHCAPHPGQHPPHPTELPRAHLRPWGGAAGALPLCPPSTLGGPSPLHRPHSRPTSPTAGGAVGSACEREGSAGRVGAMPTRGPQRGCGGGGLRGAAGGPGPSLLPAPLRGELLSGEECAAFPLGPALSLPQLDSIWRGGGGGERGGRVGGRRCPLLRGDGGGSAGPPPPGGDPGERGELCPQRRSARQCGEGGPRPHHGDTPGGSAAHGRHGDGAAPHAVLRPRLTAGIRRGRTAHSAQHSAQPTARGTRRTHAAPDGSTPPRCGSRGRSGLSAAPRRGRARRRRVPGGCGGPHLIYQPRDRGRAQLNSLYSHAQIICKTMESLCRQPKPTAPEARQPGTPRPPHGPPSAAALRIPPVNPSAPTAPHPAALRGEEVMEVRGEERRWGGGGDAQFWRMENAAVAHRGVRSIAAAFVAPEGHRVAPRQSPTCVHRCSHPAAPPPPPPTSSTAPLQCPPRSSRAPHPGAQRGAHPGTPHGTAHRCTHRCAPPRNPPRSPALHPSQSPPRSPPPWQQGRFGTSRPAGWGRGT